MKAIFYKEWIKTRWLILLSLLVMGGVSVYLMMRLSKIISIKGAVHIWEVMIMRDAIFIDTLKFFPLIIGVVFALIQYCAEMQNKRLKLTLHLPISSVKSTMAALIFGLAALSFCFASSYVVMEIYMPTVLPVELYSNIMMTALPWIVAGFVGYLFTSAIVLEPTWKFRLVHTVVAVSFISIFFLSPKSGAYNRSILYLTIYALLAVSLSPLSVSRFKDGVQD